MARTQIQSFEQSLGESWNTFQDRLDDEFSVASLVRVSSDEGYSISNQEWVDYVSQLPLSKSKLKVYQSINDNEIVELSEVELDYVVGGAAALPVLAVVIAVVTYAAVAVSAAVAAAVVIVAAASIIVVATVVVTGIEERTMIAGGL